MTGDAQKPGKFSSSIRSCLRVIRMVSELQRMGFQRLRIFPYEYPLAWRLCVAPRACMPCSQRGLCFPFGVRSPFRFQWIRP
jgi:hypothetical protein